MTSALEWKKMRRTGFFPAFLAGGLLTAAVPVVNTALRPENFVDQQALPAVILTGANWQVMSMLLSFLLIIGACIMYHTEFADNAMQRMDTLPKRPEDLFFAGCGRHSFSVLRMEVVLSGPDIYGRDRKEHGIFICHVSAAAHFYDSSILPV